MKEIQATNILGLLTVRLSDEDVELRFKPDDPSKDAIHIQVMLVDTFEDSELQ